MQYTALKVSWGNVNNVVHIFGGFMGERKQCSTQLWRFHEGTKTMQHTALDVPLRNVNNAVHSFGG